MKQAHWADIYADKIIRERKEERYTCASGITPSGTVHIGNFREIISVELVVRALKDRGITPRFIYSWDDFDVFRKVPHNLPHAEEFTQYLRMPITDIPDPWNRADNYAAGNEQAIEQVLSVFGIYPEYIYQAQQYRAGAYSESIRKALAGRDIIKASLDTYRETPLSEAWWPVSVFSSFSKKDTTRIVSWDGAWMLTYYCEETEQEETIDIRTSALVKLLWRIDWPMRWDYEQVVFEPAGKDHHSKGGSFDTSRTIVSEVYGYQAPISFLYGFVRVKGGAGKLSSSSGEVVSVNDVLEVYQPQIIRYMFAKARPNAEFAISFDLDVITLYEDYDKCERIYFGKETVGDERKKKESRVYEFSQTHEVPKEMPLQLPVRHLCNILQIHRGSTDAVLALLREEHGDALIDANLDYITVRMECIWNWVTNHAPEDFRFAIRDRDELAQIKESQEVNNAVTRLKDRLLESWEQLSAKEINTCIYDIARETNIEVQDLFVALYRRLINKEKGPRLGNFLHLLGRDIVAAYLA